MKQHPLRHVVLRSLLGSVLLACSVHAATSPADLAALRAKAETGNPVAQYNLGLAYADLHESFYDPVESYVWLNLAAGNGTTGKALAAITDTMTPVQLQEGQRRFAIRRAATIKQVAAASSPVAVSQPAVDTTAVAQDADQLKGSLNAQLADANKRIAIAQAALASKDKTIATLQGQLASAAAPASAADTNELASLREKLTQTAAALDASRRAQSLSEAETASLRASADKASAERLAIAAQLEAATTEASRLRSELDAAKAAPSAESSSALSPAGLVVLKADRDRLADSVAKLTEERDGLVRQLADLKAASPAAADVSDAKDRLAAAEKARAETQSNLDAALRTYTLNQAEIDRLQKSLANIEGERADTAAKLEAANKELVTLRPQAEAAAALTAQVATLRTQLADAQRTAADRAETIERSTQDLATARQTAASATGDLAVVREQLRLTQAQSAASANEVLELKTRLSLGGGNVPVAPSRPGAVNMIAVPVPVATDSPVVSLPVATAATGPAKPDAAPAPAGARIHVVAPGDSLSSIAKRYYGNANRWNDILEANRSTLRNADTLNLGTKLRIP